MISVLRYIYSQNDETRSNASQLQSLLAVAGIPKLLILHSDSDLFEISGGFRLNNKREKEFIENYILQENPGLDELLDDTKNCCSTQAQQCMKENAKYMFFELKDDSEKQVSLTFNIYH